MVFERDREPMGGRPGQSGGRDQAGQRGRPGLQRAEHQGGFVEHADTARVVHALILPSRMLECKSRDSPARTSSAEYGEHRRLDAISRREKCSSMGKTLSEKVWDDHVVRSAEGEPDLLFIDLHLVHEVTSPQAFDGLRQAGRPVRRPDLTLATEDHNTPTLNIDQPIADPVSRTQVDTLRRNAAEFGVRIHSLGRPRPGHRAHHRPAARADPARPDRGLRRLAHLHPRCVRRDRLRHRHLRGRARAGHPDPAPGQAEDDGGQRRRRAAARA